MIKVLPAILEKNVTAIEQRLIVIKNLCPEIHLDIMDGDFVPNTTVNDPKVIAKIKWGEVKVSLHLMIRHPELYIRNWALPAVSSMVVHREAVNNVAHCIELIRTQGKQVGIALNPHTPSYEITDYLDQIDFVMIMAVEPGFSAQAFNQDVIEKIRYLHQLKPNLPIAVDGGVSLQTKQAIVKAGATILCANSYLFKAEDLQTAFNLLKQ